MSSREATEQWTYSQNGLTPSTATKSDLQQNGSRNQGQTIDKFSYVSIDDSAFDRISGATDYGSDMDRLRHHIETLDWKDWKLDLFKGNNKLDKKATSAPKRATLRESLAAVNREIAEKEKWLADNVPGNEFATSDLIEKGQQLVTEITAVGQKMDSLYVSVEPLLKAKTISSDSSAERVVHIKESTCADLLEVGKTLKSVVKVKQMIEFKDLN